MKKLVTISLSMFLLLTIEVMAIPIREEGQKFAAYLTVIAILITLPAFISLYLHVRKTNLGHLLFQPFLAMFLGFFGIMLNSIIDIWRIFSGYAVDNMSVVMGVNRAISSILIAGGCVVLFFSMKNHGLFNFDYYQKQNKDLSESEEKSKVKPKTTRKSKKTR